MLKRPHELFFHQELGSALHNRGGSLSGRVSLSQSASPVLSTHSLFSSLAFLLHVSSVPSSIRQPSPSLLSPHSMVLVSPCHLCQPVSTATVVTLKPMLTPVFSLTLSCSLFFPYPTSPPSSDQRKFDIATCIPTYSLYSFCPQ